MSSKINNAKIEHKRELDNLVAKQKNEVIVRKTAHQSRIAHQEAAYRSELREKRSNHDQKLITESARNEKVLTDLKDSLEKTKDHVNKQKMNLTANLTEKQENQKFLHEQKMLAQSSLNNISLQDLNSTAHTKMSDLQRKIASAESEMGNNHLTEKRVSEEQHKDKISMSKAEYYKKYNKLETDQHKELLRKDQQHKKLVADQEQKKQKDFKIKEAQNIKVLNDMDKVSATKVKTHQTNFTKKYQGIREKSENVFQHLLKHREKISREFSNELIGNYKLAEEKSNDPFYSAAKIEPIIEQQDKGYVIKVKMPKHAARNLEMIAQGRKLKFSYNRVFEHKSQPSENESHSMNKHETYISNIPVSHLLNPDSVTRSYSDGHVVFRAKFA